MLVFERDGKDFYGFNLLEGFEVAPFREAFLCFADP